MSVQPPADGEDADALAAEHALGLLEGAERLDAERRFASHSGFAAAVEGWQARFAGLMEEIPAEAAPSRVWARIARSLEQAGNVVEMRLRRSLLVWRSSTAVAASIAAALAVVMILPKPPPPVPPPVQIAAAPPPPMQAARLAAASGGQAVFIAIYDPVRRAIVLTPASVKASSGKSPELWLIPTGGKPISLGVAAFDAPVKLISTQADAGLAAGTLAVSIEPRGGSPTGQPTGPVVATGQLSRL